MNENKIEELELRLEKLLDAEDNINYDIRSIREMIKLLEKEDNEFRIKD